MSPVSVLSMGALALSAQFFSQVVALSEDAQQIYSEWKQSSYYGQAVQVVNTIGGTAAGSFSSASKIGYSGSASSSGEVSVGLLESNETITFPPSVGSSATTSSSSGSFTTVTTITESEEQQRFDQALADIAELQKLHPHANFSTNSPFALLTSDEFLSYVNRFAIDPDSNPIKATTSSTAGMFTMDAEGSNTTTLSNAGGDIMTSSAASAAASASTASGSDSTTQKAGVDQGTSSASASSGSTSLYEAVNTDADGASLTPAATPVVQTDSVAGDASYATTPSTDKRDCAM
ncbi:hypothetical protein PI124_g2418 [Phytophthora idaei]|nr:hypothetical protein PI124_g2418 [Phytophthora idaei]